MTTPEVNSFGGKSIVPKRRRWRSKLGNTEVGNTSIAIMILIIRMIIIINGE